MKYHLILQYAWFLQNLGKDFIPTNMHTTVCRQHVSCKLKKILHYIAVTYIQVRISFLQSFYHKNILGILNSIQDLMQCSWAQKRAASFSHPGPPVSGPSEDRETMGIFHHLFLACTLTLKHPLVRRSPAISHRIMLWSQKFLTLSINILTRSW